MQAPSTALGWSSSALFGAFVALIALVFVVEKVIRRLFRAARRQDAD
jgi:hypothetical protein